MTYVHRALVASALLGSAAPFIGAFLVRRGMAFVGDALGHVAFLGVALGSLFGRRSSAVPVALTTVAGALAIEWLRSRRSARGDVAVAVVFYAAIATGVLILSTSRQYNASTLGILFGSLLTIDNWELARLAAALAIAVLAVGMCYRPLFLLSIDEELAAASGVSSQRYGMLLAFATASVVYAGISAVGVLLVAALLVLPAVTAQSLLNGFAASLIGSCVLGGITATLATSAALRFDLPPGASVVVLATLGYAAARLTAKLR